jgi:hypothetical protein
MLPRVSEVIFFHLPAQQIQIGLPEIVAQENIPPVIAALRNVMRQPHRNHSRHPGHAKWVPVAEGFSP